MSRLIRIYNVIEAVDEIFHEPTESYTTNNDIALLQQYINILQKANKLLDLGLVNKHYCKQIDSRHKFHAYRNGR